MNKTNIILIIIILLLVGGFVFYQVKVNDNDSQDTITELDGEGTLAGDAFKFRDLTYTKWTNEIMTYYEYYKDEKTVYPKLSEQSNGDLKVIIEDNEGKALGKLLINKDTGIATDESGTEIDILKMNKERKTSKDFSFKDNELAAIGIYPQDGTNWEEISKKYAKVFAPCYALNNDIDYYILLIPRDLNTTVSLYSCDINENGEVVKGEKLLEDTEPYMAQIGTFEYIPRYLAEIKTADGNVNEFPITFSGFDGSIVYGEHKELIHDISERLVY